jgi:dynactin-2
VESLENKINLVDQQSLELIESKISWILQKMQQLNEKKVLIEENEKITKINELFQVTSKWNDALATLPNIASRLTSLNELHQQAIQFSSALTRVDCEQQAIKQTLESNSELLKQVIRFDAFPIIVPRVNGTGSVLFALTKCQQQINFIIILSFSKAKRQA